MRVNHGLVFWGVALVAAGAVALLVQSGAIGDDAARNAWRLWPVALIVGGIAVILGRTPFAVLGTAAAGVVVGGLAGTFVAGWPSGLSIGCGGETTERVTENGRFDAGVAAIDLDLDCGDLEVSMGDGAAWSLDARHGGDARPEIEASGDELRVRVDEGWFFGMTDTRQDWSLVLPSDVELDLGIDANASSNRLDLAGGSFAGLRLDTNAGGVTADLSGATVDELDIDMNAGAVSIVADEETSVTGSVEMNAGSLELCAPQEITVEIRLEDPNVTFSHNLDDSGFEESGDTWRLGSGAADVRLEVDGNAASFSFNPDGGCE